MFNRDLAKLSHYPRQRLYETGSIWNRTKMSLVRPSVYTGPARTVPDETDSRTKQDRLEKLHLEPFQNLSCKRSFKAEGDSVEV